MIVNAAQMLLRKQFAFVFGTASHQLHIAAGHLNYHTLLFLLEW